MFEKIMGKVLSVLIDLLLLALVVWGIVACVNGIAGALA